MTIKSILWLTQGKDTLPSVRYRVIPIAKEIIKYGIDVDVSRYPKTIFDRIRFFSKKIYAKKKFDICIIQKRILSVAEIYALKILSRKVVFDFDDAIWTDQDEASAPGSGKKWGNFKKNVTHADIVIAGNSYLAEAAHGAASVAVLPTPLDTIAYIPCTSDIRIRKFTVGWMGTSSYLSGLQNIAEQIQAVTGNPIQIVSNAPPTGTLSKFSIYDAWAPEKELFQLQNFTVGLMPLSDTPYTRGKCGFKILQYMSCGVVPIASSVGFNKEIISHGVDGFLVESEHEWGEYVSILLNDQKLLKQMAQKARQTVVSRFDISGITQKLLKILAQN